MFSLALLGVGKLAAVARRVFPMVRRLRALVTPPSAVIFLLPFPLERIGVAERNGRRRDPIYRVCHISPSPPDLIRGPSEPLQINCLLNPHRFHARFRVTQRHVPRPLGDTHRFRIEAEHRAQMIYHLFKYLTNSALA